jgi:GT2 family glycosyltransferase
MSEAKFRVAIVAAVHNRRELTLLCLRSLSRIRKSEFAVHIVIVDDGSTDGTTGAIRQHFPDVEVVAGDGSLYYTEGTNAGIRAALKHDPKYVLIINDDSVFDQDFLHHLVDTAERYPRSVVGPLLLLWDEPHKLFQTSPVWRTFLGGWRHWSQQTVWTVPDGAWKVDVIVGNCVLVPTAAIKECGLMDSKHFPNFGDAEYTPRLRRAGWQPLIDPRARVFCQPNSTPARVRNLGVRHLLNVLVFDLKQGHNLRRRFFSHWYSAPSKISGVAAFGIFLARTVLGRNIEGQSWQEATPEAPLKEVFAQAVVNDSSGDKPAVRPDSGMQPQH